MNKIFRNTDTIEAQEYCELEDFEPIGAVVTADIERLSLAMHRRPRSTAKTVPIFTSESRGKSERAPVMISQLLNHVDTARVHETFGTSATTHEFFAGEIFAKHRRISHE